MLMFEETGAVVLNMLRAAVFGMCAGVLFDLIYAFDRVCAMKKSSLFAVDVGWCLFTALAFFVMLLAHADGEMRLLWFACAASGGALYVRVFGKLVRRVLVCGVRLLKRICRAVFRWILRPVGLFIKKIFVFFIKPLKLLKKCITIAIYRFKLGKTKRRISGRKREWLREQEKAQRKKEGCLE